jgi:hypothetical protein
MSGVAICPVGFDETFGVTLPGCVQQSMKRIAGRLGLNDGAMAE